MLAAGEPYFLLVPEMEMGVCSYPLHGCDGTVIPLGNDPVSKTGAQIQYSDVEQSFCDASLLIICRCFIIIIIFL